jgi:hypothetical protein
MHSFAAQDCRDVWTFLAAAGDLPRQARTADGCARLKQRRLVLRRQRASLDIVGAGDRSACDYRSGRIAHGKRAPNQIRRGLVADRPRSWMGRRPLIAGPSDAKARAHAMQRGQSLATAPGPN